ncbi:odorant receptor 10a-like isoform X1 [Neodiprion fabricii]|uniref:odorant receptor 10a-like isoform X1 n=1 Tax=Neodiprion fabricii TaxID=2872261 RepID=UPI001ED96559|nr:odorant receptor 10a-like isoform X1 [Neodiprion fabricii]
MITPSNHILSNQFTRAIHSLRCVMIYLGIWPGERHQNWYLLLWFFHSASLIYLTTGSVGGLIVLRHNANKIINNLGMSSPTILIVCKWFTFAWRKKLCKRLMHFMDDDWVNLEKDTLINKSVPDSKRIIINFYKTTNFFVCTFIILASVATVNFLGQSFLSLNRRDDKPNKDNIFPMPYSWYPVNYDGFSYIIQFLVFAQISSMLSTFLATTAIDGFLVATILHLSSQLKILRLFIEGIVYEPCHPQNYKKKVREMVKRHQVLLRKCLFNFSVAAMLQECYSLIALQHVMACVLALCFLECSFLMELQENEASRTSLLTFGLFAIGSLETAFIYCFAGDSLTNEGFAIGLAIYRCEWYSFTRSANLSLSIAMIRAQKPIEISAAQIFPLTLENFTVIVKAAASYLSTLRAYSMVEA